MPTFTGTEEEFTCFVMPYVRNYVQYLTRPAKKELNNVCQHCSKQASSLDAAHKHGHERPAIVHELLQKYKQGNVYVVDLDAFQADLFESHSPLSDHFLFLCKPCHRKYDASNNDKPEERDYPVTSHAHVSISNNNRGTLPIETIPADNSKFTQMFLESGFAVIRTTYRDGSQKEQDWNLRNFKKGSNLIGNLRSRPQFRQGKWQAQGIKEVLVYIPSALRAHNG